MCAIWLSAALALCRVGTDVDYSLALHPYGLPLATGDFKLTSPYAGEQLLLITMMP